MMSLERTGESAPQSSEPEQVYPPEVVERWREGAQQWRGFRDTIPSEELQAADYKDIGCLQAMFLGEKPAIFANDLALHHTEALEKAGFKHDGEYMYDEKLVSGILKENPEIFAEQGITDVTTLMERLNSSSRGELHLLRGVTLGFPLKAIKSNEDAMRLRINGLVGRLEEFPDFEGDPQADAMIDVYSGQRREGADLEATARFFEKYLGEHAQDLGIEDGDLSSVSQELRAWLGGKGFNAYGVYWFDLHNSPESQARQARLKAAFEESGILEA